jgi:NAD(P)-dependent dehydrogenase (short-subunit alcohol dehydrogenase family)
VDSRSVNISSRLEKRAKLNLDTLDGSQGYQMWQAYSDSKFCNLLFTYELDRRLAAEQTQTNGGADESKAMPVTVNAVTPGIVNSSLGRHAPSVLQWLSAPLRYLLMRTPEKGAETVVFAASSEAVNNISGKYWADCEPIESSAQSHDEQLAKALWQKSEELVNQVTTRETSE